MKRGQSDSVKDPGGAEKKKYKEDWKGKKKLSRVAGPKSTWMASQLPPKILTLPVKKRFACS